MVTFSAFHRQVAAVLMLGAMFPAHANSQEQPSTGTIRGRVTWRGDLPESRELTRTAQIHDAEWIFSDGPPRLRTYPVDAKSRGLKDVLVYVTAINGMAVSMSSRDDARRDAEKVFEQLNGMTLDNAKALSCEKKKVLQYPGHIVFYNKGACSPDVVAVQHGEPVILVNCDKIAYMGDFNTLSSGFQTVALRPSDLRVLFMPSEPIIKVTCPIHPWIKLYVSVVNHSMFAMTNEMGEYVIKGVPQGKVSLSFRYLEKCLNSRHELVDSQQCDTFEVVVTAGGVVTVDDKAVTPAKPQ